MYIYTKQLLAHTAPDYNHPDGHICHYFAVPYRLSVTSQYLLIDTRDYPFIAAVMRLNMRLSPELMSWHYYGNEQLARALFYTQQDLEKLFEGRRADDLAQAINRLSCRAINPVFIPEKGKQVPYWLRADVDTYRLLNKYVPLTQLLPDQEPDA